MFKHPFYALTSAICLLLTCVSCMTAGFGALAYTDDLQDNAVLDSINTGQESNAMAPARESSVNTLSETSEITEPITISTSAPDPTAAPMIDYQTVKPYEVGQILIVMYHGLTNGEEKYTTRRSVTNFKQDLQTLYDKGFRLMSLRDWHDNHVAVAAGYTPIVFTFDDGLSTAFSLEMKDGALQPVTDCAVDILTKFNEEHPDFGNTATFFVNGDFDQFEGEGTLSERLQYLIEHGYEIGNHAYSHLSLENFDAGAIQKQIGKQDQNIRKNTDGYIPYAFSYPFGVRPQEDLRRYILDGIYDAAPYHYDFAVCAGPSTEASIIGRKGFDPLNVPRVCGSDCEELDLGWMLRYYDEHPEKRYISDGDPDRISVPEEYAENVDKDALEGKEIYIY